jgi:AAHS family 4-hydroxybenzoate transporter-like MFS transporter
MTTSAIPLRVDVAALIDDSPISLLQIRVFALCAFVALLDGLCSQGIGVAAPAMRQALGVSTATFSWAFSAGLFGAAIGAMVFGPIADRIGRQPTLTFAVSLFGLMTLATAFAESFSILLVYRFVAGLGLGGAIPCFVTMGAEYAPARRRAMYTSLLWSAYPLGNAVGGFVNAYVISSFTWPMVFVTAAAPTLITAALLPVLMPESLRFQATSGRSTARTERTMRDINAKLPAGPLEPFARAEFGTRAKVPFVDLFTDGRAAGTILLGLILLLGFATTTVAVLQTPTLLLRGWNVPPATSSLLVSVFSLMSVCGMAIAGRLVERFGPAGALAPAFISGAAFLASLGQVASSPVAAAVAIGLLGFAVPMGASGTIALTAMFYPTSMRSAGTGWAMGLGRFGQVLSPLVIGLMIALSWASSTIFVAMATAPLLAGLCVLLHATLSRKPAAIAVPAAAGSRAP